MNFDKKSRNILIVVICVFVTLLQFLPTLLPIYTNSDSPADFANALFVTSEKPVNYPFDIYHYRFYSKFKVATHATVSADAYLPLPPTYLMLLYPFFKILSPMKALSFMYLLTAMFSGLSAFIIFKWVKRETNNDSAGMISAFIFGILPVGYIYFQGGDFPQIMGNFFLLLTVYYVRIWYDKITTLKYFLLLTGLITLSLLIHLGSTVCLLFILLFIFLYKIYKILKDKHGDFKHIIIYVLSVLLSFGLSILLYYRHFIDVFLSVGGQSTTGNFFVPQLLQIKYLFREYWMFPFFIIFGWYVLRNRKDFRAYLYLWILVALGFFVANIEVRYVYLMYIPIAMLSGICINVWFENEKYRKYVIYFLAIICVASFIYYSSWWTHFLGYDDKIQLAIGVLG